MFLYHGHPPPTPCLLSCAHTRISYRIFCWGGGGLFQNSEIDIKHTFLGGSRACPPRKCLTNHCPEIESGGFWQLADCSQVPIVCVQNRCHFLLYGNYIIIFLNSGGGGGGGKGNPRVPPPLYEALHMHTHHKQENSTHPRSVTHTPQVSKHPHPRSVTHRPKVSNTASPAKSRSLSWPNSFCNNAFQYNRGRDKRYQTNFLHCIRQLSVVYIYLLMQSVTFLRFSGVRCSLCASQVVHYHRHKQTARVNDGYTVSLVMTL